MNKAIRTSYRLLYILGLAFLIASFVMVWPGGGNVGTVNANGLNLPNPHTPTPTRPPPTDTPTEPPPTDTPTPPPTDTPTEPPPTDTPTEPPPTDTPTKPPPTDTPTPPTGTPPTDTPTPTLTEIPADTPTPSATATQPTVTATGEVVISPSPTPTATNEDDRKTPPPSTPDSTPGVLIPVTGVDRSIRVTFVPRAIRNIGLGLLGLGLILNGMYLGIKRRK